jgi:hypothetical protein
MREMLVDALRDERRAQVTRVDQRPAWPGLPAAADSALIESDRFLLRLDKLREAQRRPHAKLDGVGFEIAILRLLGQDANRDGLVEDVFNLVHRDGFGERAAGGVVEREAGGHRGGLLAACHAAIARSYSAHSSAVMC